METANSAEPLYTGLMRVTQIVEYGTPASDLFSGAAPPPAGVRLDVWFEGAFHGRLTGTARGVDYLHVRADGRIQLHIHAEITTTDGKKIAFEATGGANLVPGSSVLHLRESVTLTTTHAEYAWVNLLPIWATGSSDVATGEIHVAGFVGQSEIARLP